MKRSIFFTSIYVVIFIVVSVPLILNIKINEVSNKIDEINTQIYLLERRKNSIDLKHHESYSISSIEKLAKSHSYKRLEISHEIEPGCLSIILDSDNNQRLVPGISGFVLLTK